MGREEGSNLLSMRGGVGNSPPPQSEFYHPEFLNVISPSATHTLLLKVSLAWKAIWKTLLGTLKGGGSKHREASALIIPICFLNDWGRGSSQERPAALPNAPPHTPHAWTCTHFTVCKRLALLL